MGFIGRQADLIADIAASKKLSATRKREDEAVIEQNHFEAATEVYAQLLSAEPFKVPSKRKLESGFEEEQDNLHLWAAILNNILAGSGIKWDGSEIGTEKWIRENQDVISPQAEAEMRRTGLRGEVDATDELPTKKR